MAVRFTFENVVTNDRREFRATTDTNTTQKSAYEIMRDIEKTDSRFRYVSLVCHLPHMNRSSIIIAVLLRGFRYKGVILTITALVVDNNNNNDKIRTFNTMQIINVFTRKIVVYVKNGFAAVAR